MSEVLNKNTFLIKEHTGLLKTAYNYDIVDPETNTIIMECREDNVRRYTRFFRLFNLFRHTTPFDILIKIPGNGQLARVTRGIPLIASNVKVFDENNVIIGGFKQRFFSISGTFDVVDANDNIVCTLKGGFTGSNHRFLGPDNVELASVTKQWAGLSKEIFTSADNFLLHIDDAVLPNSITRRLVLGSVICIAMVLKIEIP